MIKVLVVDDHELIRTGIGRLLTDYENIKVVGEAIDGEEALSLARKVRPHVVLMDANMPGIGGLEATRRLIRFDPDLKVVAVTVHHEEPFPTKFMQAGASGYLTKGADISEIVMAIRQVHSGKRYITPEIAQEMALKAINPEDETPFDDLSDREMQVMIMITQGQKVQYISDQLFLSPKTINSYRYRLFEKLKIENDVELTHMAIRYGLVESEKII
ncbi:MAG: UvrY/SirA/GacA family response regulator transcription factor [Enterobacterales bacterium]|nr:UvrY/SirA/GacA family response regulator transcription factor [Enterobacterales bacterium]